MTNPGKRAAVITSVVLALVPLLLFAYLGLHNRLLIDDYVNLGLARDIGTWKAMLVWREFWNGGYSNFILYGLLSPLGETAPPLFALFLCASIFVSFGWLINTVLVSLSIRAHRLATVVALASITTAAAINGFYHAQVFYWLTGAVVYNWPAVMLLFGIAMATATAHRLRGRIQLLLAAISAAIYAFISAGFSEMYLVFQSVAVALIAVFVFIFPYGPTRRTYRILATAACLGTIASLLTQVAAPGFANRSSQSSYFGDPIFPVRDLPNLISRTLDLTLDYTGHQTSFAGFMLVVFAGLFLTMSASTPMPPTDSKARRTMAGKAPIAFALGVQLLFVPVLWTHSSDSTQILGRFSYAFAAVVGINLLTIAILLALLWRRDLLAKAIDRRNGLMMVCGFVLLLVSLLFALTQVRNINFKAASYLFITAVMLINALAWQLSCKADEPYLKVLCRLSAFAAASAFLTLAFLIAVNLWGQGQMVVRTLASTVYALMFAGLLNGVTLGILIVHGFQKTDSKAVWLRYFRLFSLVVSLTIAAGIVIGQAVRISYVRQDAQIWDETHEEILRLRDARDPAVYTKEFPRLHYRHVGAVPSRYRVGRLLSMHRMYYGLDLCDNIEDCVCSEVMIYGKPVPPELHC